MELRIAVYFQGNASNRWLADVYVLLPREQYREHASSEQ